MWFTGLWAIQGAFLLGVSALEDPLTLAIIGGVFTLFNTFLTLWWTSHEKSERRNRRVTGKHSHKRERSRRSGDRIHKNTRESSDGDGEGV